MPDPNAAYLDIFHELTAAEQDAALTELYPEPEFLSDGPRVARWLALYVVQTKGRFAGKPLLLEQWQYEFVCELFRLDPLTGRRVYTEALLLLPRKNGKSTLASGIGLYMLCADFEASPEVYVAAGSRDQAAVVGNQAKDTVRQSPALADFLKVYQHYIYCPSNLGRFKVIPSDAKLQHGTNPSASIIDEKWAHRTNDLATALTSGTGARDEPLSVTITTFGDDIESPLGEDYCAAVGIGEDEDGRPHAGMDIEERLLVDCIDGHRRGCLRIGRDMVNGYLFWSYAPPHDENFEPLVDLDDPEVWELVNPGSWVTTEFLSKQRNKPNVRLVDFRRFHLNVWAQDAEYWLPRGAWGELAVPGFAIPERDAEGLKTEVFGAVDIGQKKDRAAFALVYDTGDTIEGEDGETLPVYGADVLIWEPPGNGRSLDIAVVRAAVREAHRLYDVREVAYDPWRFEESAQTLADEGVDMFEFAQSNEQMCPASQLAYDLITTRRIRHNGDTKFAAHVLAGATTDCGERGWRLTKRKATKPIDALIALTMALARADASGGEKSTYEDKDMLVLGG